MGRTQIADPIERVLTEQAHRARSGGFELMGDSSTRFHDNSYRQEPASAAADVSP